MMTAADLTQSSQKPNPKLLAATIAGVVALHVSVGIGIMNMPILTIEPLKVTPPLEISFVSPPKSTEHKPIKLEPSPSANVEDAFSPKITPKPVTKTQLQPEPKPKPSLEPNIRKTKLAMQPVTKVETVIVPTPKFTKTVKQSNNPPQATTEPVKEEPKLIIPPEPQLDQKFILAQQGKEAEQIAQQRAQAERAEQARQAQLWEQAENERLAREQTERQKAEQQRLAQEHAEQRRAAQERLAKAQAERESAERAQAEKLAKQQADNERTKKQLSQNTKPVNLGGSGIEWRVEPNTNLSSSLKSIVEAENITGMMVRIEVDSKGNVSNCSVAKSSGNAQIDKFVIQRIRQAKLKPKIVDGIAVSGYANIPIAF